MAVYKTVEALVSGQVRRLRRVHDSTEKAFEIVALLTNQDLKDLLSGTLPMSLIRKIHPYRKKGGSRYYNRKKLQRKYGIGSIGILPINKHTGQLLARTGVIKVSEGKMHLRTRAPYGRFVIGPGTDRMVWRGLTSSTSASGSRKMGELEKRYATRMYLVRKAFLAAGR